MAIPLSYNYRNLFVRRLPTAITVVGIALVVAVYFALRWYKRGKPPGYTATLVRFLFTPKFYTLPGRE